MCVCVYVPWQLIELGRMPQQLRWSTPLRRAALLMARPLLALMSQFTALRRHFSCSQAQRLTVRFVNEIINVHLLIFFYCEFYFSFITATAATAA